jgi:aminoglycoside 2''-phosphotransferase
MDVAAVSTGPAGFVERFSGAYGVSAAIAERARFYRGTFSLQEALFGIEHGDEEAFRSGIAPYQ